MSLFPLDRVLASFIRHGRLKIIDVDGRSYVFGAEGATPAVAIRIHDAALKWRLALNPGLAVGEAYVSGDWTLEEGTLRDFLEVALVSQDIASGSNYRRISGYLQNLYRTKDTINPPKRAKKNVRTHYDKDHELYELFLDSDMQYSCAYWRDGVTSLDEAQTAKKEHIGKKLRLEPGMTVLDIGSGWGGLGLYLAREHHVKVTGVTLSVDQYETSVRRAEEEGLADHVSFELKDYRELAPRRFDRIVSVGMFEHVGRPHFSAFFRHLRDLLSDDGVALIHTIGRMRDAGPINSWIQKYIFPGSYLPLLSELMPMVEKKKFWLADLEVLRLHYARTLHAWDERFQAHRATVASRFGEEFCRMWEFYLQGCEQAFRYQELCVFQLQLAKKIDRVPITRDYIYEPGRGDLGQTAFGDRNLTRRAG